MGQETWPQLSAAQFSPVQPSPAALQIPDVREKLISGRCSKWPRGSGWVWGVLIHTQGCGAVRCVCGGPSALKHCLLLFPSRWNSAITFLFVASREEEEAGFSPLQMHLLGAPHNRDSNPAAPSKLRGLA